VVFRPAVALTKTEVELIRRCGAGADGPDKDGCYYVYVEDGFWSLYIEGDEAAELVQLAHEVADAAEPGEHLEEVSGESMILSVLQRALRRMPPEVKHVEGEAACTCSKMRPDGFGGAWYVINREQIVVGSSGRELERLAKLEEQGLSLDMPGRTLEFYRLLERIAGAVLPDEPGFKRLGAQEAEVFIRLAREAIGPLKVKEENHG
jgi:hypothetical protein